MCVHLFVHSEEIITLVRDSMFMCFGHAGVDDFCVPVVAKG